MGLNAIVFQSTLFAPVDVASVDCSAIGDATLLSGNLSLYELVQLMASDGWEWQELPKPKDRGGLKYDWRTDEGALQKYWYSGWDVDRRYLTVLLLAGRGRCHGRVGEPIEHGKGSKYYFDLLSRISGKAKKRPKAH
eukprot:2280457-Pyramimonas_sp.AAC.1